MKINNPQNFCRYYHGESTPPDGYSSNEVMFWSIERSFFYNYESIPPIGKDTQQYWIENIPYTAQSYDDMAPFLLDDELPIETRALIAYATEDLGHMNPISQLDLPDYFTEKERNRAYDKSRRSLLLSMCKFYKGNGNPYPPDNIKYTYCDLEDMWINHVIDNEGLRDEYAGYLILDFGHDIDEEFGLDFYLIATMYDQYTHWGGSKESFKDWLRDYVMAK